MHDKQKIKKNWFVLVLTMRRLKENWNKSGGVKSDKLVKLKRLLDWTCNMKEQCMMQLKKNIIKTQSDLKKTFPINLNLKGIQKITEK